MFATLLVTFRETLEAALIVGIVFAFLKKSKEEKLYKFAYFGIFAGILLSIVFAIGFNTLAGGFEGKAEEIFEGATMLIGAGLLTTVIIFMQNHAKNIKSRLTKKVERNEGLGIFFLILISILREGVETVIFLAAISYAGGISLFGSILGVVLAIILGYLIFTASLKIDLKKFFNFTSVLLILFAAGLVAHGIHEFEEAGILNPIVEHVWDINPPAPLADEGTYPPLHEKGVLGSFAVGLFGYNGNPSLLEVLSYIGYLVFVIFLTKSLKVNSIGKRRDA